MELKDLIEAGATKAGSLTALGKMLDLTQPQISNIKAHKRPLPMDACVKLAQFINRDLIEVIAANELATEKKVEKREFWTPYLQHAKAASVLLSLSIVTTFVTPTPAEAAQSCESAKNTICIM